MRRQRIVEIEQVGEQTAAVTSSEARPLRVEIPGSLTAPARNGPNWTIPGVNQASA